MAAKAPMIRRLLTWRGLLGLNLVLAILVGAAFGREWVRQRALRSDIEALQQRADALYAQELGLSSLTASLQTQSFVEQEARLKLGLKRPDEQVVVVQGVDNGSGSKDFIRDNADRTQLQAVANPTKWWYYFFNRYAYERLANNADSAARR